MNIEKLCGRKKRREREGRVIFISKVISLSYLGFSLVCGSINHCNFYSLTLLLCQNLHFYIFVSQRKMHLLPSL